MITSLRSLCTGFPAMLASRCPMHSVSVGSKRHPAGSSELSREVGCITEDKRRGEESKLINALSERRGKRKGKRSPNATMFHSEI